MRRSVSLTLLLLAACATNPVTGKNELSLVSESQEIAMGRSLLASTRQETGFYPDQALNDYVAAIGLRMAHASERPDLPWEFHVVDDPAVNAFAAPGGFIFVTRGILAYMNSEAELAGVLGHEIGHVTAKHSVSQISKQQLFGIGLIAGSIAAPDIAGGEIGQIAQTGAGLLFLKFGRDDERQADALGFRYALEQHYDVRQIAHTFETLQRLSQASSSSSRVPGFLSTHPDPGDRVATAERWADTVSDYSNLQVDRNRYLSHLEGLVFGDDPRQGYFDDQHFLHPVLKFQFTMPTGWQGVNQATRVIAVEPNGKAQVELSQAHASSLGEAVDSFSAMPGVTVRSRRNVRVSGLPAITVGFSATTQQRVALTGEATFISYDGSVYRMLGLTTSAQARAYLPAIEATINSFGPTSRNQSFRRVRELHLITLGRSTTPEQLASASGGAATARELAIINETEVGTAMPRGRMVKTIRYR